MLLSFIAYCCFGHLSISRDYMSEISACIDSGIPSWSVRHLSLWNELVAAENIPDAEETIDLGLAEENTAVALYQEVRAKISFSDIELVST